MNSSGSSNFNILDTKSGTIMPGDYFSEKTSMIIDIINECFEFSLSDNSINNVFNMYLKKICEACNIQCAFIGEKGVDNERNTYFRYYGIYGLFEGDKYLASYAKNGFVDLALTPTSIQYKILETGKCVIRNPNDTSEHPKNHSSAKSFCAFPLKNKDEIIGIIEFSRNTLHNFTDTDIKNLHPFAVFIGNFLINVRNAESVERHKLSFIANMSHEVRTPLNAIVTMIEMLSKTNLSPAQYDFVDSIKICSSQLTDIVNDILDYSKIISNGMELKIAPMSIVKCIKNVFSILKPKADEKKLDFTYTVCSDVPDMIISDMTRLKQILLNLLSNAIKFTKVGSVHLEVQLTENKEDECELYWFVKDTGIGIKKDKIKIVFDSFRQIDNDYLSDSVGVGLGLPITKHILDKMGGKIWIDSTVGLGTVVHFTTQFKLFKNNISEESLKKYFSGKNVLVINSDFTEKLWIFNYLLSCGIVPILTNNIAESCIYLANDTFSFEFILINTNDVIDDEMTNIYKYKNFFVKVIIVDADGIDKKILNYDYKLIRPLNDKKIIELMSMIYVTNLYQAKSVHNQIFRNDKAYRLTDVLGPDSIDTIPEDITSQPTPQIKKNIKILVGEDNKQNQKVMVALLNSIGWTNITLADDGFKTFKELTDGNYDVAFVDLKMPVMSGISAVTQFKKLCEKDTVTIAVTASVADDIKKKCLDAKMDGFIAKPIDVKALEAVMDSVVSKKFKTLFK